MNDSENLHHLFFKCEFSNQVWDKAKSMANVKSTTSDWTEIVQDMTDMGNRNNIGSVIRRLIFAASVYCIWQERNARIFKDERKRYEDVYNMMIETVKCKLLNLTVKESLHLIGGQLKSWSDKGVFGIRRLDMYKGLCFYPSDAFNSMSLSLICDGYMQIGDGGVLEGNVARMKEHLIHCEWGYILHNDACSSQSFAIVVNMLRVDELSILISDCGPIRDKTE
ncbi:hypothetical protein Tco_0339573 [Tanacetum coccineum]